ncbi:GyrI-like domain-containing protein [Companilactobacillus baiquanensis]|uniref:GyrI-like domain-containing protein n=1 Tax=Companilactobacillus baiquanensis TaxID=2486005 RepID=A0ABW1USJ1_9LACO|nr:GyrI-like domain-containing protein [Companilactobacillus baiquanensis]
MKYEWRKQEKSLYLPKQKPVVLNIPKQTFISLPGQGDPNGSDFKERLQVLYPISYGIKAAYRKFCQDKDVEFDDYVVFPLEGVWSLTEAGQKMDHLDKNEFVYDIMMRIPDFVPEEVVQVAIKNVKEKKYHPLIEELEQKTYQPKQVIEILHVGKYDDEPASFKLMDLECQKLGKTRASMIHREIYLSDARRVAPDKLKTVLRYEIK